MRVFVARVRFFALLDEHFLLSFLTNVPFVCIMGEETQRVKYSYRIEKFQNLFMLFYPC